MTEADDPTLNGEGASCGSECCGQARPDLYECCRYPDCELGNIELEQEEIQ